MKAKQRKDSSYFRVLPMIHSDVQVVVGAIFLWGNIIDGQAMFTCGYFAIIVVILCDKTFGEEAELNVALGDDSSLFLSLGEDEREIPEYDIGHWSRQFHLQRRASLEIEEESCALFVELRSIPSKIDNADEVFLSFCDCETSRSWISCPELLVRLREFDCIFVEPTALANTSARILSANNPFPCNCTISMGYGQFYRTTDSLYFLRDVCGIATSAVGTCLGTKTSRISALCYQWSALVCEHEGSKVSSTTIVTCRNHTSGEPAIGCSYYYAASIVIFSTISCGPGLQKYSTKVTTSYGPRDTVSSIEPKIMVQRSERLTDQTGFNEQNAKYESESGNKEFEFALLRKLMFTDQDYPEDLMPSGSKENNKDNEDYNKDEEDDDEDYNEGWGDDSAELDEDSDEDDYLDEPSNAFDYARRSVGKDLGSYVVPRGTRKFDSVAIDKRAETPRPDADNCHDTELGGTDGPLDYMDYDPEHGDGWDDSLEGRGKAGPFLSPSMLCQLAAFLSIVVCTRQ